MAPRVVVRGHAWRGTEVNPEGVMRFSCECGTRGFPVWSVTDAREDHRLHKQEVQEQREGKADA